MTEFRPGRFQVLPPIVKQIIIINVLVVLLEIGLFKFGINLHDYFALHYWKSDLFRPWQLFTHIFMHGSPDPKDLSMTIMHLFSNMFALWMFGSILENLWGPKRFLLFYIVCGIGAAICHLSVLHYEYMPIERVVDQFRANPTLDHYLNIVRSYDLDNFDRFHMIRLTWENDPSSSVQSHLAVSELNRLYQAIISEPTVGASGAVFGVLFAFGYLFPNTLIYLYFFVPLKAKYFVAFYALFELFAGIRNTAGDNVAHFAHLGGMLFAFILLRIWNKKVRSRFY